MPNTGYLFPMHTGHGKQEPLPRLTLVLASEWGPKLLGQGKNVDTGVGGELGPGLGPWPSGAHSAFLTDLPNTPVNQAEVVREEPLGGRRGRHAGVRLEVRCSPGAQHQGSHGLPGHQGAGVRSGRESRLDGKRR